MNRGSTKKQRLEGQQHYDELAVSYTHLWPNQGTNYILTEDNDGNCSRSFKTFLTCVEHSNNGFETQWGDNFGQQFKNKLVGGVFGIQMDFYNGRELEKRVLRWFVSHDKAEEAEIPMETETQAYKDHINGYPGYPQGSTCLLYTSIRYTFVYI